MRYPAFAWIIVFLATLSEAVAEPPATTPEKPVATLEEPSEATDRLRAVLRQRRAVNWNETPLGDVAQDLAEMLEVDVLLDTRALEDAGHDAGSSITLVATDIPLQKALEMALGELGLDTVIEDGFVVITTTEKVDALLLVRVYEVSDLVLNDLDDPHAGGNYQPLIDSITATVAPETWDMVGGAGAIRQYVAAGIEAIIVSQTAPIHDEIEAMLAGLRRARRGDARKARIEVSSAKPVGQSPFGDLDSGLSPPSGRLADNPDRDSLVQPQLQLACDLYAKLAAHDTRTRDENIVFSPYGIATAMALVSAGAGGETARELLSALHADLPPERFHPAMAAQADELPIGAYRGTDLRLANRLWVRHGDAPPAGDFIQTVRKCYGTDLGVVNFAADDSRVTINDWIATHTAGRVRDFIAPDAFNQLTRLVLVNAVSFRGTWDWPFQRGDTKLRRFHAPSGPLDTPTMYGKEMSASYANEDGLEILGKEYARSVEMTILLPAAKANYAEFEKSISADNLRRWLAAVQERDVNIFLPKFKIAVNKDLVPVLASLGVQRAFSQKDADFSAISPDPGLFLQDCKHRAEIELDEEGTIAVAVTSMMGGAGGQPLKPPEIPTFRADRPFVFLIRDTRTGTILFMGRVMDPSR